MVAYIADIERKYHLEGSQDILVETCRLYQQGYANSTLDAAVQQTTTICAKRNVVPISCAIDKSGTVELDDACDKFREYGGALQWSEQVIPPEVNNARYSDFFYVSPDKQVVEGFPSTCFDIFGRKAMENVCEDTSSGQYPDAPPWTPEIDKVLPCKSVRKEAGVDGIFTCDTDSPGKKCELSGFCSMPVENGGLTTIKCTDLYDRMNCTDIAKYFQANCDCFCAVSSNYVPDSDDKPDDDGGILPDIDVPDWYYKNKWCMNGIVDAAVPFVNEGNVWVPFRGDMPVNTFPYHVDCGKVRGLLFEGKFEEATEMTSNMCKRILDKFGDDSKGTMEKVVNEIEKLMEYAYQLVGMTASLYNALVIFRLTLPVAICIAPAILTAALRTKLLVPQSSTPGLFIQLLPWLYCPVVWCIFNFLFQLIGNVWLLPGMLLISYTPMAYFAVGVWKDIGKPMSKEKVTVIIYWLEWTVTIMTVAGYGLLAYGLYVGVLNNDSTAYLLLAYTTTYANMLNGEESDNEGRIIMPSETPEIEVTPEMMMSIALFALFSIAQFSLKYTFTTIAGVDFMMYELIEQRFYELYLEKGDRTAKELQVARINRTDSFLKLISYRLRSQMQRSTSGISRRTNSDNSSLPEVAYHVIRPASFAQVLRRERRLWDMINNGRPSVKQLLHNLLNTILLTPLHLKRSRSKLEITKKMAGRAEVAYLSKKYGLYQTDDAVVCFELMVWRRSALWILVMFGAISTFFAVNSINNDYHVAQAYEEFERKSVLHRFPEPGYVNNYTFEHFNIDDPADWTYYSGPMTANATDPSGIGTHTYYFSISSSPLGRAGERVGLSKSYLYSNAFQQWSYVAVNESIKNEQSYCLDVDMSKEGIASAAAASGDGLPDRFLVTAGCINDFVREVEGVRDASRMIKQTQAWVHDKETGFFVNGNGRCIGHYSKAIPKYHDRVYDESNKRFERYCGSMHPLINGDPAQCPSGETSRCCDESKKSKYRWLNGGLFSDDDSKCVPCFGGCLYYDPFSDKVRPECIDYKRDVPLSNMPLVETDCDRGTPIKVELPQLHNVIERAHSFCDDETICKFANSSKMYALFDKGMSHGNGSRELRWRCYAEEATKLLKKKKKKALSSFEEERVYDKKKLSPKYCDGLHGSITSLLERAQGREDFDVYMDRMVKVAYARVMSDAENAMISINGVLMILTWAAFLLAYLAFHFYSRYKLSRMLVMAGWFCTFLAPFIVSIIPLRLFLRLEQSEPVQRAMLNEYRDHNDVQGSKEERIVDTCKALQSVNPDTAIGTVLKLCAFTQPVDTRTAHSWGDITMSDDTNPIVDYKCTADLMNCGELKPPLEGFPNGYPYESYPYCISGQEGRGKNGGYPAVPMNPCEGIGGKNDEGVYELVEQYKLYCDSFKRVSGFFGKGIDREICDSDGGYISNVTIPALNRKCMTSGPEVLPGYFYNGEELRRCWRLYADVLLHYDIMRCVIMHAPPTLI